MASGRLAKLLLDMSNFCNLVSLPNVGDKASSRQFVQFSNLSWERSPIVSGISARPVSYSCSSTSCVRPPLAVI